ncbi:MAG: leucine--tRNA ligase, partial [Bacteroidetes bacterium]|nr:leucine--tRNA ligase [Bacteroidota bacterium]
QRRSERERISETKTVTGAFTGAYAVHPFTHKAIPIYISEYVLAGYGTGAIMAVPSGDERDHAFAKHFDIKITNVFGARYDGTAAYSDKEGTIEGSDFLSGLPVPKAIEVAIRALEDGGIGTRRVNYKLRDAGFSRQRYWGEPFPVTYQNDIPYTNDEPELANTHSALPLTLPHVDSYRPGPEGQGPLANIEDWVHTPQGTRETNTMPGYAGSSWYFFRYMDPHNEQEFASRKATDYWQQVDVYVGGTEHAVGHLLYARMWTKTLADLGYVAFDEPFKKLVNQGMIQGSSRFAYLNREQKKFSSFSDQLKANQPGALEAIRVSVDLVDGLVLDVEAFRKWRPDYADFRFEPAADGKFYCSAEVEKMSKSKYNVVNPDDIVAKYGADTFRMYEMFLGPIELSKPWDTQGIEGVHRFLKKLWRLYLNEAGDWLPTDVPATEDMLRSLHRTIKKLGEDIERFGFNTCVSALMICVNELSVSGCRNEGILESLVRILAPLAPHLSEDLWHRFGHEGSVTMADWPAWEAAFLTESSKTYPVAVNGKPRTEMSFSLDENEDNIREAVLANETIAKWLEGREPKKFIYVKGKMINVVV